MVELGENIQTQVIASSAGDVVIIREEYQKPTISINQPIRLVREKRYQCHHWWIPITVPM